MLEIFLGNFACLGYESVDRFLRIAYFQDLAKFVAVGVFKAAVAEVYSLIEIGQIYRVGCGI